MYDIFLGFLFLAANGGSRKICQRGARDMGSDQLAHVIITGMLQVVVAAAARAAEGFYSKDYAQGLQ